MNRSRLFAPLRGTLAAALVSGMLAACSHAPVAEEEAAGATAPRGSTNAAFEQQQRTRARDLTQQGYYGEAAVVWEVLALLRPDVAEYADNLAKVRGRASARAAQRLQSAGEARRRGDNEQAAQLYLQVLGDDPLNTQAAEALRAIERDRNKRNYLGQLSRITLARNGMADAQVPRSAGNGDRNDLEHATLLMHQGEYAEAVRMLERYVKANPQDEAGRKALAEACYQQAERIASSDPKAAQALYQRAVKVDPAHGQAAAKLRQAKAAPAR